MNLGVDVFCRAVTPPRCQPGIGLRPGGERPDLEAFVQLSYAALYDSVAAHSRHGLNVVVDVGHHDDYSQPLHVLRDAARRLGGLPVLFVGVRCPVEVVMERRGDTVDRFSDDEFTDGAIPPPVLRWQREVHRPGVYDLEVDTSVATPEQCAELIRQRLGGPPPTAFWDLATEP
jgi:chloramphenicol 3-O phosphotransferase